MVREMIRVRVRVNLLVNDLALGRPHHAEDRHGHLGLGTSRGEDISIGIQVVLVHRPPPLEVEHPVGILRIDGVAKGINVNVGKCRAQSQSLLRAGQVGTIDGSDYGASEDVLLVVDGLVQLVPAHGLGPFDVLLGLGNDVEAGCGATELEVFEHGRFGLGAGAGFGLFSGAHANLSRLRWDS